MLLLSHSKVEILTVVEAMEPGMNDTFPFHVFTGDVLSLQTDRLVWLSSTYVKLVTVVCHRAQIFVSHSVTGICLSYDTMFCHCPRGFKKRHLEH